MSKPKLENINVLIPTIYKDFLKKVAREENKTVTEIVNELIEEEANKYYKKLKG